MTQHLWIGVKCKTPGCYTFNLVQYEGPYIGQVEIGSYAPTGFDYLCAGCHKPHHYAVPQETETRVLPQPPPPGWKNAWGPKSSPVPPPDPKTIH
jgi:hypothetical protein